MASGLFALLDDVAAIAKVAAAGIDDVGTMAASALDDTAAAAAKASAKAAGVVVDDAAVTPRYVVGFTADRELPIVAKIARGSLRNKLLILLPGALALSWLLPVLITPLLMAGGAFLCFEGAEKLWEKLNPHDETADEDGMLSAVERENTMVSGAIRTDLILSAEIMAIALGTVEQEPLLEKAAALIAVALGITVLVYGAVAMIVKADDLGVRLARQNNGAVAAMGRGLVSGMPGFLAVLGWVGLLAMLWVGGHIVIDGLNKFGVSLPHDLLHGLMHAVEGAGGVAVWLAEAGGSGVFGLALGALVVAALHAVPKRKAH
jgi:predicted DNA repair protein MutK